MIDLHCHLLPDVDDGPRTVEDAVAMARVASEAGTTAIVCTPHMIESWPTDPADVHAGVARLRDHLARADVALALHGGGEIALPWLAHMDDDALRASALGGGPWLLVELPFRGWPLRLGETIRDLELRGFGVVLAHPERSEAVQRRPDRVRELIGLGALMQLTAGSFLGDHGPAAQRAALVLLGGGAAHLLASDGHSAGPWRPPVLEDGLQAAAEGIDVPTEALSWMVTEGPAAILAGERVRPPKLASGRRARVR